MSSPELAGFTNQMCGLELVVGVGWPYRGTMVTSFSDGGTRVDSHTIGQPAIGGAHVRSQCAHYPIKQINAKSGWEYWFMHGKHTQGYVVIDDDQTQRVISGDAVGMICKNPERTTLANEPPFLDLGAPLKVNGEVINVSVYATQFAGELCVITGRSARKVFIKNYPVNPVAGIYYSTGTPGGSYTGISGATRGLRTFEEIVSMPISASRFTTRVHGFYENRILFSVGVDPYAATSDSTSGYCTSTSAGGVFTISPGFYTRKSEFSQWLGWQPFLYLELVVNGDGPDDVEVNVVHDWTATAGNTGREQSSTCGLTVGECVMSAHQTNAVIDVFYNDSGSIESVYGDFSLSSITELFDREDYPPIIYRSFLRYTLRHRFGGDSRELDFTRDISSSQTGSTYRETLNGDVIFEHISNKEFKERYNILFNRAPYPGSEIRCINMPWSLYPSTNPETGVTENLMSPARTFTSATGRNCVALYMAQDSSDGKDILTYKENTKTVSNWSMCHNNGFTDMQGFSMTIDPENDERGFFDMLGFMNFGARSPVNPVTGEVVLPPAEKPLSYIHYI